MDAQGYVERCHRWRFGIIAVSLAAAVSSLALIARLELRPQLAELLPEGDPVTLELERFLERVGASADFEILIKGGSPEERRRFADALVARLRLAKEGTWRQITYDLREELDFFRRRALLYLDYEDLA